MEIITSPSSSFAGTKTASEPMIICFVGTNAYPNIFNMGRISSPTHSSLNSYPISTPPSNVMISHLESALDKP